MVFISLIPFIKAYNIWSSKNPAVSTWDLDQGICSNTLALVFHLHLSFLLCFGLETDGLPRCNTNKKSTDVSNLTLACPSAIFRTRAWVWALLWSTYTIISWDGRLRHESSHSLHVKSQLWTSLDLWSSSHLRLKKKKTHSALQQKHTNTPLVDFSQIPQIVGGGLPYTNQDPTLINLNNVNLRPNSSCELRTSEARPRSCTSPEIPPETVWPKWSGGGRHVRIQKLMWETTFSNSCHVAIRYLKLFAQ